MSNTLVAVVPCALDVNKKGLEPNFSYEVKRRKYDTLTGQVSEKDWEVTEDGFSLKVSVTLEKTVVEEPEPAPKPRPKPKPKPKPKPADKPKPEDKPKPAEKPEEPKPKPAEEKPAESDIDENPF